MVLVLVAASYQRLLLLTFAFSPKWGSRILNIDLVELVHHDSNPDTEVSCNRTACLIAGQSLVVRCTGNPMQFSSLGPLLFGGVWDQDAENLDLLLLRSPLCILCSSWTWLSLSGIIIPDFENIASDI